MSILWLKVNAHGNVLGDHTRTAEYTVDSVYSGVRGKCNVQVGPA